MKVSLKYYIHASVAVSRVGFGFVVIGSQVRLLCNTFSIPWNTRRHFFLISWLQYLHVNGDGVDTWVPVDHDELARLKSGAKLALARELPTTTIVAQPFNVIKWQLKFNPVA